MSDVTSGGQPAGQPQEPEWPREPELPEGLEEAIRDIPRLVDGGSLSAEEIENMFGFHKATSEGPEASTEKHANLRHAFKNWAGFLSLNIPKSRYASLMFTALEQASMWAHKAIAETDPIDPEA